MLPEYRFDYSKARPNRFAGRVDESRVVVVLDPDVSEVFTTPESVNKVLRALISNMPAKGRSGTSRGTSASQ
jgi:hypothetical protein